MITVYTSNWCGYCNAAKNLLNELNIDFKEINIEENNISREELVQKMIELHESGKIEVEA